MLRFPQVPKPLLVYTTPVVWTPSSEVIGLPKGTLTQGKHQCSLKHSPLYHPAFQLNEKQRVPSRITKQKLCVLNSHCIQTGEGSLPEQKSSRVKGFPLRILCNRFSEDWPTLPSQFLLLQLRWGASHCNDAFDSFAKSTGWGVKERITALSWKKGDVLRKNAWNALSSKPGWQRASAEKHQGVLILWLCPRGEGSNCSS